MTSTRLSLFVTVFFAVFVRGEVGNNEDDINKAPRPDNDVNKQVPEALKTDTVSPKTVRTNYDRSQTRVRDLEYLLQDIEKVSDTYIKQKDALRRELLLDPGLLYEKYVAYAITNQNLRDEIRVCRMLLEEAEKRDSPSSHKRKKRDMTRQ